MNRRLFIGNLSYAVDDEMLLKVFSDAGINIKNARVIRDRETGQSRGFGFVEMLDEDSVNKAKEQLSGTTLAGRTIRIEEASQQPGDRK